MFIPASPSKDKVFKLLWNSVKWFIDKFALLSLFLSVYQLLWGVSIEVPEITDFDFLCSHVATRWPNCVATIYRNSTTKKKVSNPFFPQQWQQHLNRHISELSEKRGCVCLCLFLSICVPLCPESTDEEVDKLHCLNHSGSSATYSDYSPSQGSSGSSNPPANAHSHTHSHSHQHTPALPASKDQAPQTHWTNRYAHVTHASCFVPPPSLPPTHHYLLFFWCNPPFNLPHLSSSIKSLHLSSPPSIFQFFSYLSSRSVKVRVTH